MRCTKIDCDILYALGVHGKKFIVHEKERIIVYRINLRYKSMSKNKILI